jgi:hypothetical protein
MSPPFGCLGVISDVLSNCLCITLVKQVVVENATIKAYCLDIFSLDIFLTFYIIIHFVDCSGIQVRMLSM